MGIVLRLFVQTTVVQSGQRITKKVIVVTGKWKYEETRYAKTNCLIRTN